MSRFFWSIIFSAAILVHYECGFAEIMPYRESRATYLRNRIAVEFDDESKEIIWHLPNYIEHHRRNLIDFLHAGEIDEYLSQHFDEREIGYWLHFPKLDQGGSRLFVWSAGTPMIAPYNLPGDFTIYSSIFPRREIVAHYAHRELPNLQRYSIRELVFWWQRKQRAAASLSAFANGTRIFRLRDDIQGKSLRVDEVLIRAARAPLGEYIRVRMNEDLPDLTARGEIQILGAPSGQLELLAWIPGDRWGEFHGDKITARQLLLFAKAIQTHGSHLTNERACEILFRRIGAPTE